jgi:pimeloyl-ACP methyl ester carboxylesterase
MQRLIAVIFAWAILVAPASAQTDPVYVQFAPSATKGVLYTPDSGTPSHVAFVVVHRTSNFLSHPAALELSARGFTVMAMNPRFDNNEALVDWEDIALDIEQGVEYLRARPGITRIVLIGHSGGGPASSYYQAVAENGPDYCRAAGKLSQCSDAVAGLPRADGVVFLDAHPGNGINTLRSLNPAVVDESRPFVLDPTLDPFNTANGFNPDGNSVYSEEFQERYFRAQSARMNRLIAVAESLSEDMQQGRHFPADNDSFVVYRDRSRLSDISTMVACCTTRIQKLIRDDGSIDATSIVRTVRVPTPSNAETDASFDGTAQLSVHAFLSANAIRSEDSDEGIDWCSSNNSTVCAVRVISVPVLVMAMQGHYFIRDGELIYDNAASTDKDLAFVEGAIHGLDACTRCSEVTGVDYSNARKNLFDYVAAWTNAHYAD